MYYTGHLTYTRVHTKGTRALLNHALIIQWIAIDEYTVPFHLLLQTYCHGVSTEYFQNRLMHPITQFQCNAMMHTPKKVLNNIYDLTICICILCAYHLRNKSPWSLSSPPHLPACLSNSCWCFHDTAFREKKDGRFTIHLALVRLW